LGSGALGILLPSLSVFTALVTLYLKHCDLIYRPENRESLTPFLNSLRRLWTLRTAGVCSLVQRRRAEPDNVGLYFPQEWGPQLSDTHPLPRLLCPTLASTNHNCSRISFIYGTTNIYIHDTIIHITHYVNT
jgi:hypothetical protein